MLGYMEGQGRVPRTAMKVADTWTCGDSAVGCQLKVSRNSGSRRNGVMGSGAGLGVCKGC